MPATGTQPSVITERVIKEQDQAAKKRKAEHSYLVRRYFIMVRELVEGGDWDGPEWEAVVPAHSNIFKDLGRDLQAVVAKYAERYAQEAARGAGTRTR